MRQDRKIAAIEERLEKTEKELRHYKVENKVLEREIKNKQRDLDAMEDAYKKLEESYEKYMFTYSEHIEKLEEARLAYEDGLARVKKIMKEYKAEAAQMIAAFKETGKVV